MAAHENNPFSREFRERIKRVKEERERQERETRERHEREERERQEYEARERYEKEERERQEYEARERYEKEERERQECEARERYEKEERERQECEARERYEKEEQERQKIEEDKKQTKLKEVEEIKNILKDDFKAPYKAVHFLKLLSNLQYLYSISSTRNIEYIDILHISNQANTDELLDLKIQISTKLPKIPGNFSAFMTVIDEDEYATMIVHNHHEGIKVKFNDPRGVAIPPLLEQVMVEVLGIKPMDFQTRIEGPSSIIAMQNFLEFISFPDIVILIPESLDPEQNKLLKVLHVLYSCDLLQDIIPEADKFLEIFHTAHTIKDSFTIEANARAILNYYSIFENMEDHNLILLNECRSTLSTLLLPEAGTQKFTKRLEDEEDDFVMLGLYGEECIVKTSGQEFPIFEDYLDYRPN